MSLLEKEKMVILAQQILSGTIGIVEGCRKIEALKVEPEISNEDDFLIIQGIESETDEFPIGEVRKHYHKESLEKLDKELNKYIERVKPIIFEACRNIINKYSVH